MPSLIPAENWDYSLKDLFYGLNGALSQNKNHEKIAIEKIGTCLPIRSGRAAIVLALKALNLQPGGRVAVPLYSCPAVFKAIDKAGCTPVFVDIERDTFCMSAKDLAAKRDQIDAVIAIHMFGNLCDMHGLLAVAREKPIIEDCAQSLGSDIHGHMSGTFGTMAIFSFRSGKYLSVGEGGALYARNPETMSRLEFIMNGMSIPTRTMEVQHAIKTYIRSKLRTRPLYGLIGSKLWKIYNRTVDYSAKTPVLLSTILQHDLRLTKQRLTKFARILNKQRANADYYSNHLKINPDMICFEKSDTFYNRFAYPILFSSIEKRDALADYLFKKKIDTIKPYQDCAEIASKYYGYAGGCPVAELVAKTVLIIPSHSRLKQFELDYIVNCFNKGWAKVTARPIQDFPIS
ncbi:hypothetical protein EH223_15940 [candidate division KSB1 bacterium]|nr:DegT/DnrJ/EryC1/StrS family aminotransferase [candidate division KSB1 bacterium]RQW01186.1 MAG: hypothetical protein EH223_15940 [candidate division KSB1 bacterium]